MDPVIQPAPIEQPKQNNFLTIILSILLLISVSIAGYFAYQTQKLVKELTLLKSSPTPVSSSESTLDPTTNWKIFIHPTYKYQFKYPADWTAKINSNAQAESLFGPNATQNSGIGGVEVRELEIEPKDFYKLTESKVISSDLLRVNDINGYRYEYQNIMKSNGFVFKHSDGLIYNVYINTEDEAQLKIFDQILSTFEFTDQTSLMITKADLDKGWYWGDFNQKKEGTPQNWIFTEAGKSSCWHSTLKECGI